jgi:hypothetical protein
MRTRARAARLLLYALVAILCIAGLRAILSGPPKAPAPRLVARAGPDQGAQAFAESFARAYLTWDAQRPELRARRLAMFLPDSVAADAGLTPAARTSQNVLWSAVEGVTSEAGKSTITIAAQTSNGVTYLSVPVQRDGRGFMALSGYPAIVGPPAIDRVDIGQQNGQAVDDAALVTVARRALTNYLAGARPNLMADLARGARVSLPEQHLQLTDVSSTTWVVPNRTVALNVSAQDNRGSAWTLRYELGVTRGDRWFVQSIAVDPTFPTQGGQ